MKETTKKTLKRVFDIIVTILTAIITSLTTTSCMTTFSFWANSDLWNDKNSKNATSFRVFCLTSKDTKVTKMSKSLRQVLFLIPKNPKNAKYAKIDQLLPLALGLMAYDKASWRYAIEESYRGHLESSLSEVTLYASFKAVRASSLSLQPSIRPC